MQVKVKKKVIERPVSVHIVVSSKNYSKLMEFAKKNKLTRSTVVNQILDTTLTNVTV